jgi:hypothetical protein
LFKVTFRHLEMLRKTLEHLRVRIFEMGTCRIQARDTAEQTCSVTDGWRCVAIVTDNVVKSVTNNTQMWRRNVACGI